MTDDRRITETPSRVEYFLRSNSSRTMPYKLSYEPGKQGSIRDAVRQLRHDRETGYISKEEFRWIWKDLQPKITDPPVTEEVFDTVADSLLKNINFNS